LKLYYIVQIAAYLDPTSFQLLGSSEIKKCEKLIKEDIERKGFAPSAGISEVLKPNNNKKKLSLLERFTQPKVSQKKDIDQEIIEYRNSNKNGIRFENYWPLACRKLPILGEYVKFSNILPATSVPCESSFSRSSYIERKQRARLSSNNIRYSLVVKGRVDVNEIHKMEFLEGE